MILLISFPKVLDAGKIKEFDKPYNLLKSKNNLLYKLVAQTGRDEAQKLFEMARRSHLSKTDRSSKQKKNSNEGKADQSMDGNVTSSSNVPSIHIIPDTENDVQTTPL